MKKISFGVLLLSVLIASGAAFAEGAASSSTPDETDRSEVLTTKEYVDDGLRYVYDKKADRNAVYTKKESDDKFLTFDREASEGAVYVYTSEGWSELGVQGDWSTADTVDYSEW